MLYVYLGMGWMGVELKAGYEYAGKIDYTTLRADLPKSDPYTIPYYIYPYLLPT